jgi:cobalamin biosynthesis protein CobT
LPIVAAALGRKFGVTVAVGGQRACTDGTVIQLPDLPEDPAVRDLAWGYLAHEAAHVRYTDFGVYRRAAQAGPLQAAIQNILEDVRIERALAGPYPGTRATIATVVRRLLEDGDLSAPAADAHPAVVLQAYLLLKLRHQVLGQALLAAEAERAERLLHRVFPASAVTRLDGLLTEVPALESTRETVDLARRIVAMLEDDRARLEMGGPGRPEGVGEVPGKDGAQSGSDSPDDAGNKHRRTGATRGDTDATGSRSGSDAPGPERAASESLRSKADTGATPGSYGDEGPEASVAPVSSEDHGPEVRVGTPSRTDADPTVTAGADTGVAEESGEGPERIVSGSDPPRATSPAHRALAAALGAGPSDIASDLFQGVGERLAGQSRPGSLRLPVAQDVRPDPTAGRRLLERVQAESARLRARLHGLVQASRMDRPRNARTGRRLAHRQLHRTVLADDRVFRRNHRRVAPNTAVHLVVDVSGSMAAGVSRSDGSPARRVDLALESALALALALESIPGTSVGVTAFPGQRGRPDRVERMLPHGAPVRARAGAFSLAPRGGTPMAEAMGYAAAELLLRPEARRLLLVLTDGMPDSFPAVQDLLGRCRESDVEVVGIGVQTDVGGVFPLAVEVGDVADLKRVLFRVAEKLLIAA